MDRSDEFRNMAEESLALAQKKTGYAASCAASYVCPRTRHRARVRREEQEMPVILTPAQCREARLALGWTMRDLGAKSKVSIGAISRLERGEKLKDRTLEDIKRVFEAAGIRFSHKEPQANEG